MDELNLPPLLDVHEVAHLMRLQPRSLWKRHREGRGPQPIREGRRLLWRRDEVLRAVGLEPPAHAA